MTTLNEWSEDLEKGMNTAGYELTSKQTGNLPPEVMAEVEEFFGIPGLRNMTPLNQEFLPAKCSICGSMEPPFAIIAQPPGSTRVHCRQCVERSRKMSLL